MRKVKRERFATAAKRIAKQEQQAKAVAAARSSRGDGQWETVMIEGKPRKVWVANYSFCKR